MTVKSPLDPTFSENEDDDDEDLEDPNDSTVNDRSISYAEYPSHLEPFANAVASRLDAAFSQLPQPTPSASSPSLSDLPSILARLSNDPSCQPTTQILGLSASEPFTINTKMPSHPQTSVSRHEGRPHSRSSSPVSPRDTRRRVPNDGTNRSNNRLPNPQLPIVPPTLTAPPVPTSAQNPQAPSPYLPTGEIPIRSTTFAPSYQPTLFSNLSVLEPLLTGLLPLPLQEHFSHLGCSYTSHPRAPAPTMEELKKHAQALCLLITTLSAHEEAIREQNKEGNPSGVLDFLPNLLQPYKSEREAEKQPLKSLRNTLATEVEADLHWPTGPTSRMMGCPMGPEHGGEDEMGRYIRHINDLLEYIDTQYESSGGLLACLPPEAGDRNEDERYWAEQTVFGQWLVYTQDLVGRVAELEREVVGYREVFANGTLTTSSRGGESGRESGGNGAQDTDICILAGLTPALLDQLRIELNTSESILVTREQKARKRGFASEGLRYDRSARRPSDDIEDENWVPSNVVAWIECTSRIYRCQGDDRLYVVPAWDIRPGAGAVRAVEEGPVTLSVPVRMGGGKRKMRGVADAKVGGDSADGDGGGIAPTAAQPVIGRDGPATQAGVDKASDAAQEETTRTSPNTARSEASSGDLYGADVEGDLRKQITRLKASHVEQKRQNGVLRDSHENLRLEYEKLKAESGK